MRVAVISDIHGNGIALDAVLADIANEPIDQVVCLGDAIQGGAQPAYVVARLRDLACPVIIGNADDFVLTGTAEGSTETVTEQQRAVREWQLAQLSADDVSFIRSFQPTVELPLDGDKRLLCFHGSPHSFNDIILPDTAEAEFQRLLGAHQSHILTGGHTHLQQIRRIGDSFFFNPGSVGLASRHRQSKENFRADPWAEYALLSYEANRVRVEFRRVLLDVTKLIHAIIASGKPDADSATAMYQTGIA